MIQKEVVFCDDCKWLQCTYSPYSYLPFTYHCTSPLNIKIICRDFRHEYKVTKKPEELNANNDCKLYEAKI